MVSKYPTVLTYSYLLHSLIRNIVLFYRCYEEDGDSNPEMMMEQALDNEMMYHGDPMVAASSWRDEKKNFALKN